MRKNEESRAESQPAKKTHVLQKQDSSKYLRGENMQTATSNSTTANQHENPEVKIPKKYIKERSSNSSVTRGANIKNSAVIYKVSPSSRNQSDPPSSCQTSEEEISRLLRPGWLCQQLG